MRREEILDLLAERPGEFVSGENISKRTNSTRAAVWKQVQNLKLAGYEIEGVTKSGYRLLKMPLGLDEWALAHELKTATVGHPLYVLEEVSSTNDWAKDAVQQGAGHGLVVLARRQATGRGRQRRNWESPQGGLWMSVVLQPKLSLADAARLTLSASLAVVDGIREASGVETGIKWPNDIVYENRKVAGILGEVAGEWNTLQSIVLGIGINCNFRRNEFAQEVKADTLQEITGREWNLNVLGARVLERLEREASELEHLGFEGTRARWLTRAVGLGQEVSVHRGTEVFSGEFRDITPDGELVLQTKAGVLSFSAGEVQLRARSGEYI